MLLTVFGEVFHPCSKLAGYSTETAIPVLNKNTYNRRSKIIIFRNNFIALSTFTEYESWGMFWTLTAKNERNYNNKFFKKRLNRWKNLPELSLILSSQSKRIEIIRPVFICFSCKWERRKGMESITYLTQSLNSNP